MKLLKLLLCMILIVQMQVQGQAQETEKTTNKTGSLYEFTNLVDLEASSVKSQGRTGTCWSFSALSFFESELMRNNKALEDLSEMFIVRNAYREKAINYVRMHGHFNFSAGGAFHDIPYIIKRYGMVPEKYYKGLSYGTEKGHNHAEMDAILKAAVDAIIKNPQKSLTPSWIKAIDGILDAYLGEIPATFTVDGKEFTPKSYAKEVGLDMDQYVILGSFTHHPFYEQFTLAVPDNWAFGRVHNLPIDELVETAKYALKSGNSLAWAADVSENGFSFRDALAIVPEDESTIKKKGSDNQHFSDAGAEKISNAFMQPVAEKKISQEMRQIAYDNYQTTDDHGMHITGMVKDQNNTDYFIVKNSWGVTYNECDGYFYASEAYFRYKTINIMVHKDAIPKKIKRKLGL